MYSCYLYSSEFFDITNFIKHYNLNDSIYEIGLKEIENLCEFYGTSKKLKSDYLKPLINAQEVMDITPQL